MRKFVIAFLIIIQMFNLYSVENDISPDAQNVLNLRGYKVGEEDYLKIVITDALYESLSIHENGATIDVSEHVEALLSNNISKAQTDTFPERVIFSYRVVGNTVGTYEISIEFFPLANTANSSYVIPARYDLGNLSYAFPVSSSNSYNGSTIAKTDGFQNTGVAIVQNSGSTENKLISRWTVSSTSSSVPEWAHRGAVAMMVDNSVYSGSDVAIGEYKAFVTVEWRNEN